jgi:hypothetical protein
VRRVVAEGLSYLSHNAARMDYPRYRRLGLPTTSSLVESLVGDFNARVKSKQKYWNRPGGAEAILQVRAAYGPRQKICDTDLPSGRAWLTT